MPGMPGCLDEHACAVRVCRCEVTHPAHGATAGVLGGDESRIAPSSGSAGGNAGRCDLGDDVTAVSFAPPQGLRASITARMWGGAVYDHASKDFGTRRASRSAMCNLGDAVGKGNLPGLRGQTWSACTQRHQGCVQARLPLRLTRGVAEQKRGQAMLARSFHRACAARWRDEIGRNASWLGLWAPDRE